MQVSEFDQFADEYYAMHQANIRITGEAPEFFAEYKIRVLHEIAAQAGIACNTIGDFGSGTGNSIPHFRTYFPQADLVCLDVSRKSLAVGRSRFPDFGRDVPIEDSRIPVPDGSFDAAFSACVFHHIPHAEHVAWLRELRRTVRPGGMALVVEHNPLNPLTVRAVNTCPFDANAHLIHAGAFVRRCREAGWRRATVRYHLFFPHALAALRPLERHLAWLPLGAQYSVAMD